MEIPVVEIVDAVLQAPGPCGDSSASRVGFVCFVLLVSLCSPGHLTSDCRIFFLSDS